MSFVDALKDIVGFGDVDYEEEEMDYEEEAVEESKPQLQSPFAKKNKVVPIGAQSGQAKIVILKPKCFNDTLAVADELKIRRPVVLDVGALDPDEARRVVDFVSGTVYGVDGNMQKVSGGIFLATPAHMDIMGEVLSDNGGFEWSVL